MIFLLVMLIFVIKFVENVLWYLWIFFCLIWCVIMCRIGLIGGNMLVLVIMFVIWFGVIRVVLRMRSVGFVSWMCWWLIVLLRWRWVGVLIWMLDVMWCLLRLIRWLVCCVLKVVLLLCVVVDFKWIGCFIVFDNLLCVVFFVGELCEIVMWFVEVFYGFLLVLWYEVYGICCWLWWGYGILYLVLFDCLFIYCIIGFG